MTFYNDIDPYVAQWLRNLSDAGMITPGVVSTKSIKEIQPNEVIEYKRAHFFAGIGTWDYVLNMAGWGDVQVWTGSCPCQPFSSNGRRAGTNDSRHLWPDWFRLITKCRPPFILGEQVASSDGLAWLDIVQSDLENKGYTVGFTDLCAAGVGAPHIRQRLYFVAYSDNVLRGYPGLPWQPNRRAVSHTIWSSKDGGVGHSTSKGWQGFWKSGEEHAQERQQNTNRFSPTSGFWGDCEWVFCKDGKYRPIEPRTFPVVDGCPQRMAKLRAIGNAIVAPLAIAFVRAFMDIMVEQIGG